MIRKLFRRLGLLLGMTPARVVRGRDTEDCWVARVESYWWATREDVFAAVAKARADGDIPGEGKIYYSPDLDSFP